MKRIMFLAPWRKAAIAVLILVGIAAWQSPWTETQGQEGTAAEQQATAQAKALSAAFRRAAEATMPSVVTIRSEVKPKPRIQPKGENPFKGTPFEDFFEDGFHGMIPDRSPQREGMGSGVIIDQSGVILTNNHVVAKADKVMIHLADGREFQAEDIRVDEQTDLAVVRIKGAGNLPAARLGDSDKLAIGDWVIAIGSPFELEQTVSAGIISGKGRQLSSIERAKFLQTDAAINPGNSGGPLVNMDGEIVGINTAIATNNGSFQGIGFAIPSNLAKWVVPQLLKEGEVRRAYLGVKIGKIDQDLANKFSVRPNEGILVAEVYPETPAAEAKMQTHDIITHFGTEKVNLPQQLQELVERSPIGSKIQLQILRDGKPMSVEIVAKALPKSFGVSRVDESDEDEEEDEPADSSRFKSEQLGLEAATPTAEQLKSQDMEGQAGVMITQVDRDGIASRRGLRPGMLILSVNRKTVSSVQEFRAALANASLKDGILFLVRSRGTGNNFVVLKD